MCARPGGTQSTDNGFGTAAGLGPYATVAGGSSSAAAGPYAAVGGGLGAAGRAAHTAVLLVLGGGVGSSVAVGGVIHRGSRGMIEGGHMIVQPGGPPCGCGQRGCLEALASGTAIAAAASKRGLGALEARQVAELASDAATLGYGARGWAPPLPDKERRRLEVLHCHEARGVMGDAADALATACINVCRVLDPHVIVLAGGVATPELVAAVDAKFKALAWTILPDAVHIRRASAGADG